MSINNKLEKDIKINDINYNENKTNISNNENNNIDKKEKEIEKSEEDKIIQKIIINKFYLYLCFICIKKRKNIQNILLDEGMKVIKEKLDIINIFKNLCRDELYQEKEKINETEIIEMSDSCKNNLEIVYKNKFKWKINNIRLILFMFIIVFYQKKNLYIYFDFLEGIYFMATLICLYNFILCIYKLKIK